MNEYDQDQKVQFCERFQRSLLKDAEFVNKAVWIDEASLNLSGTMNCHSCIYWSLKNLHIYEDKVVNLPGCTAWCRMSSRSFNGSSFFKEQIIALGTSTCFGHPLCLPLVKYMGMRGFTFNITIEVLGATSMNLP